MSVTSVELTPERYQALLNIEDGSQKLVDAMEKLPDASAQLLGLKALLKPAEPVYVPLVDQRDLELMASRTTHYLDDMRGAIVLGLRAAADRLASAPGIDDVDPSGMVAMRLREWAYQEEKCNA